jgi:hypothetical protein
MVVLHDPAARDAIRARIRTLSPASPRRWGRMTPDQMLWHVNQVFRTSLGEAPVVRRHPPFPTPVLKLMLFKLPWPRGAPTAPEYVPEGGRDFEAERRMCLELMDRFAARRLEGEWSPAVFGPLTGREWSRLHLRHLDHHLGQFSV